MKTREVLVIRRRPQNWHIVAAEYWQEVLCGVSDMFEPRVRVLGESPRHLAQDFTPVNWPITGSNHGQHNDVTASEW